MTPQQKAGKRAVNKKWRQANLSKVLALQKHVSRRCNYGITADEFEAMRKEQKNRCAICKRRETKRYRNGTLMSLSVDHDHKTKRIRGLLCDACNRGLGCFKDDAILLAAATCYVAAA